MLVTSKDIGIARKLAGCVSSAPLSPTTKGHQYLASLHDALQGKKILYTPWLIFATSHAAVATMKSMNQPGLSKHIIPCGRSEH
jgi:hypothetical protein